MVNADLVSIDDAAPAEVAALRWLDLISADDVVRWAAQQVATSDYPSMVDLAVMSAPVDGAEVREPLAALLAEAGEPAIDAERARTVVATWIARRILDRTFTPIRGARLFWWKLADRGGGGPTPFDAIIGAASEWEDDPENRDHYERVIVEEAKRFARDHG